MKLKSSITISFGAVVSLLLSVGCTGNKSSQNDNEQSSASAVPVPQVAVPDSVNILIDIKDAQPLAKGFPETTTIEFSEECENFVGMPHNIEVRGDTLYIVDSFKAPGFYAYLRDGSQLFAYTATGTGPEEFFNLTDMKVTDTAISAFDYSGGCIVEIDKSGQFLRKVPVAMMTYGAMLDGNGGVWADFSNQAEENVKLAHRADSLSGFNMVIPVPEAFKGMVTLPLRQFHSLENGEIIWQPSHDHRIYTLDNGNAILRYNLDFKDLWPSDKELAKYQGNTWAIKMRDFPVSGPVSHETDRRLLTGFQSGDRRYLHIFDKTTGKGRIYFYGKDEYYTPQAISGNEIFLLRTDGNVEVLEIR